MSVWVCVCVFWLLFLSVYLIFKSQIVLFVEVVMNLKRGNIACLFIYFSSYVSRFVLVFLLLHNYTFLSGLELYKMRLWRWDFLLSFLQLFLLWWRIQLLSKKEFYFFLQRNSRFCRFLSQMLVMVSFSFRSTKVMDKKTTFIQTSTLKYMTESTM